jgi:hypothetical protein
MRGPPPRNIFSSTRRDRPVRLIQIARTPCDETGCPTVYLTEHDTVVVQGYRVRPADAGIDLPPGEILVEIPRALFDEGATVLRVRDR